MDLLDAALNGREADVARSLAQNPSAICAPLDESHLSKGLAYDLRQLFAEKKFDTIGAAALWLAVKKRHHKVVAALLAAHAELAKAELLYLAVDSGADEITKQFLAVNPSLAHLVYLADGTWRTLLHHVAQNGLETSVAYLIEQSPDTILVGDKYGYTPLQLAVWRGHVNVAEKFLAIKPELVFAKDIYGDTLLHRAIERCSLTFIEKLWRMNPSALHVANNDSRTPFDIALSKREKAMELLESSMSLDEIARAFEADDNPSYKWRFTTLIEQQCEALSERFLLRDLVGLVYEYLDITRYVGAADSDY